MMLCKTYLNSSTVKLFKISGYNLAYSNRLNKKNRGVATLIKGHLKFKEQDDLLVFQEGEFEGVFVELEFDKGPGVVVVSVYRIPGTSKLRYITRLKQIVHRIKMQNKDIIIGTDQNIDYLKLNTNKYSSVLFEEMMSMEMFPTITKPT